MQQCCPVTITVHDGLVCITYCTALFGTALSMWQTNTRLVLPALHHVVLLHSHSHTECRSASLHAQHLGAQLCIAPPWLLVLPGCDAVEAGGALPAGAVAGAAAGVTLAFFAGWGVTAGAFDRLPPAA